MRFYGMRRPLLDICTSNEDSICISEFGSQGFSPRGPLYTFVHILNCLLKGGSRVRHQF